MGLDKHEPLPFPVVYERQRNAELLRSQPAVTRR